MLSFLGTKRVLFTPVKGCKCALFEKGCGVLHIAYYITPVRAAETSYKTAMGLYTLHISSDAVLWPSAWVGSMFAEGFIRASALPLKPCEFNALLTFSRQVCLNLIVVRIV